ncbi:unnamed protein product [Brassica rapa subsp. trilocularis]
MNMHSLGGYHVIVAMQVEKDVLLNAQGSASISVAQFPGIRFSYLETALFWLCLCSQEAEKAMGCLDASRGGMFLHCASSCWKEFCQDYFSCPKQKQGSGWDYYYRLVRRMNKLLGPELMNVWINRPLRVHIAFFEMPLLCYRFPLALHPYGMMKIHAMHDEDTRDAFSFQKNRLAGSSKLAYVASPGGGEPSHLVEATSGDEGPRNFPDQQRDPMEEGPTTIKSPGKKTLCGFADVYYWPDSLGPMDLDIRSSKHTEDLNLNKSLDGLRRLIATSLDAFQNCSVFGFDSTKDTSNMV